MVKEIDRKGTARLPAGSGRAHLTFGQVLREGKGRSYRMGGLNGRQRKVLRAVMACRTAELGTRLNRCDSCGDRAGLYNSCRDRHCPTCGGLLRIAWVEGRLADLLPVDYLHITFKLQPELRGLALRHKAEVYDILLRSSWETIRALAVEPLLGANVGCLAVLQTWTQLLIYSPHVHCLLPAGGLSKDRKRWIPWQKDRQPSRTALTDRFRETLLRNLALSFESGRLPADPAMFSRTMRKAGNGGWDVYLDRRKQDPGDLVKYLARYVSRVAITDDRLVALKNGTVSFRCRTDGTLGGEDVVQLEVGEFLRRFLLHLLPRGFQTIRYFGLLGNRVRQRNLARIRKLLGVSAPRKGRKVTRKELYRDLPGRDPEACAKCGKGRMREEGRTVRDGRRRGRGRGRKQ